MEQAFYSDQLMRLKTKLTLNEVQVQKPGGTLALIAMIFVLLPSILALTCLIIQAQTHPLPFHLENLICLRRQRSASKLDLGLLKLKS